MENVLFFFKVKHNDSQWCIAISYLQWIVISMVYSTRLEVFQCPGRKNIKKIEEKRKKKNHRIWTDFKPVYRAWLLITWSRLVEMKIYPVLQGPLAVLWLLHKFCLAITCKKLHPGKAESLFCTAGIPLCRDRISFRFYPPPNYFPVLPPIYKIWNMLHHDTVERV